MSDALNRWFRTPPLADRLRSAGIREDLVQAAERTAFGRPPDARLVDLLALLTADEAVVQVMEGRSGRVSGLLVLTSRRLLFVGDGRVPPTVLELTGIQTVESQTRRGMSSFRMTAAGGTLSVDRILGNQADSLADNVRRATAPPVQSQAAVDPVVQLDELRALYHAGMVDDAEYRIRKQQLFDQI